MQLFFYLISSFGLAYFLLAKRRFDWFAVAFFSACVYFLPGFFGYTAYLSVTEWVETSINDAAFGIMILVEFLILAAAIMSDLFPAKFITTKFERGGTDILNRIILALALIGLLLMLLTTGSSLFYADKQWIMDEINRSHILFYTATIIGATLSFEARKWIFFAFYFILIAFDLFIGFRTSLAIMSISIFTLWLSNQGEKRLLINFWKQVLAGILLFFFLSLYSQIAFAIRFGDWHLLRSILNDPDTYVAMINKSEPFITQSVLNEVIIRDYSVGMGHLRGIFDQFILFAPELGLDPKSFNDLFQNALFPEVYYGMANNIWAEMWSAGGWLLLFIFILIFVLVLKGFTMLSNTHKITQRAFVAVLASYWSFYIHRNDIGYEIVLMKRAILIMISSLIVATVINNIKRSTDIQIGGPNREDL